MISSYTTDIIRIIEIEYDANGVLSKTESGDIEARVEDTNNLIRNIDGKEVMPNMLLIFDYENEINPQWKIKVRRKHGSAYYQPDKEWEIMKFENLGMFSKTHNEVFI
jgi:hypothetical protein